MDRLTIECYLIESREFLKESYNVKKIGISVLMHVMNNNKQVI